MRISGVTDEMIKEHCGISGNDSDGLLAIYKDAALGFMTAYTGLSAEQLDELPDAVYAYLAIVCEMFETREMTVEIDKLNPMAAQILNSHRRNLL